MHFPSTACVFFYATNNSEFLFLCARECIVSWLSKQYLRVTSREIWSWSWIEKSLAENGRGVREDLISYLISSSSVWSNSVKITAAETLFSAIKSGRGSWKELRFSLSGWWKSHFYGWPCLGLLSLSVGLWATSCLQWTEVSNIMLTYGVKYRSINSSWPNGWRAQSCSYSCAGGFLNKTPEPDLHQQCAPVCKFAGWSSWWPVIPQESCKFHIFLSYWCADSPASVVHLLHSVFSSQAYRPSPTWWWAM